MICLSICLHCCIIINIITIICYLWSLHHLHLFLSQDGKKILPIIPGISTTPGQMVYAGSIGTQIANELLDFNRCGLSTQHVHLYFMVGA